ncbi:Ion transport protein [Salinisphaera sp. PC39]|uniref:potassium channel family protein n=1 Tax=Salinisphaera sp. PC39 TaxID=1304156 RepID=UPI003341ACD4
MTLRSTLKELYAGTGPRLRSLRWLLLAFDVAVVIFFLVTTFMAPTPWLLVTDYVLAAILFLDYAGRWVAADDRVGYPMKPMPLVDAAVLLSLLAPALLENLGFLRVLRTLRLLRSYHVLRELRHTSPFFARHEEVVFSALNLIVFVFLVSALVYVLQVHHNESINDYVDALYFTVTTLTTTGFGDITLTGSIGRLLAVVIMIVGVSLFLRLIQTIFRPAKINYACPDCGLTRHEPDAVHCKHCGRTLRIPTQGE